MAFYELGNTVPLAIAITGADGKPADADTVTLTVVLPDGTVEHPDVHHPDEGSYFRNYEPAIVGRYTVKWVSTGDNAASYIDTFVVTDAVNAPLVSLADFKTYINVKKDDKDTELMRFLISASDLAEEITGRQFRVVTITETFEPPSDKLALSVNPTIAVTGVVEDGKTLAAGTDYRVDKVGGVLTRLTSRGWGAQVTVTWIAGETNPPMIAYDLVMELARHMWRTQRGNSPGTGSDDQYVPGGAYAITYRAKELSDQLFLPGI